MSKVKLDTRAARTDLTTRECSKIVGSLVGGLLQMTDPKTLRDALRWFVETDDFWVLMERSTPRLEILREDLVKGLDRKMD
jgi:hypothetical protein